MVRTSPSDTPLMRQYLDVKSGHPDAFVFFRLGDFYELFFEDAVEAARLLELTLTTRDKGREDAVPMCGVPHHAARGYISKLLELGRKVVLCEQVEDPRLAKGIVKREVVRVITPGCLIDDEQIEAKANRYVAALELQPATGQDAAVARVGLAYLDVTTGELRATELPTTIAADELARVQPHELLWSTSETGLTPLIDTLRAQHPSLCFTPVPAPWEQPRAGAAALQLALDALATEVGEELSALERQSTRAALAAAARVVAYARSTQLAPASTDPGATPSTLRPSLPPLRLRLYQPTDYLILDATARTHLELFETMAERKRQGSLLELLDQTKTAMGGRLLRRWLAFPLHDLAAIRRRLDAVERLVEQPQLRATLRDELAGVYDLERLAGRCRLAVATARDLVAVRATIERLPQVAQLLARLLGSASVERLATVELLAPPADLLFDIAALITATLVDDPPAAWREQGGAIRRGFHPELDELIDLIEGGKNQILRIEARERERTGISSLKIRYNRVFGYYIELTRANLKSVPDDYVRKQTLANAERFVTAELSDYEAKVLGAEERRIALEAQLFDQLRADVAAQAERLVACAERLAELDVLATFGELAHRFEYVRPEMEPAGGAIEIEGGRHPVVERLVPTGSFVANDLSLGGAGPQLLIITGPNMAGKSTAMRQVALITLLAHMGSFVPATRARLGLVDRLFTRVGAGDNLARGESTFMVEMRETAEILRRATSSSLVVLDEIGRGTSTYDGVSIAWAVVEYLHDQVGAKTLMATHYHELIELGERLPRAKNVSVAVRQWKDEIVFLRRLVPGGASRSFGIEVAKLAGLPRAVVSQARNVLARLESTAHGSPSPSPQLSLFGTAPEPTVEASSVGEPATSGQLQLLQDELSALEVDAMTPMQALSWLARWREQLAPRA